MYRTPAIVGMALILSLLSACGGDAYGIGDPTFSLPLSPSAPSVPEPTPSVPEPTPLPALVTIQPRSVSIGLQTTQVFTASIAGVQDQRVTWSILEGSAGGTITADGIYTASSTPGIYHVVVQSAASPSSTDSATISVTRECAPETDAAFCSRLGKDCGAVSGVDNCGGSRSVGSCGTCLSGSCGGGGLANVCGSATPPSYVRPFYSDASWINRPISYWQADILKRWGALVDPVATAELKAAVGTIRGVEVPYFTTDENSWPVYVVRDGDPDLMNMTLADGWVCPIGGHTTIRAPKHFRPPSAEGLDQHVSIVDLGRGIVYSFYDYAGGAVLNGTVYTSKWHGCDLVAVDKPKALALEASRWSCSEGSSPSAYQYCGMAGIGSGLTTGGNVSTAGTSGAAGTIMPEDFSYPDGTLGHALTCTLPAEMLNGFTWPTKQWQAQTPGKHIRLGSILTIDPALDIDAMPETPDWEKRVLKTWQKYGCVVRDNGMGPCMNGQAAWAGRGGPGVDAWAGILPPGSRWSNGAVPLRHFPWARVQVLHPNSNLFGAR